MKVVSINRTDPS